MSSTTKTESTAPKTVSFAEPIKAPAGFRLPRRMERKIVAKARKEAEIVSVPAKSTKPIVQAEAIPTQDMVNVIITRGQKQSRRKIIPGECIIATLPANALEGIIVKLSANYSILSVLSLTHTCRTLADRIAICKIVRLSVEDKTASNPRRLTSADLCSYNRTPYAQLQIDTLYPTIHRYGTLVEINVVSPTEAILKKKSASGIWGHSVRINGDRIIHVHSEYGNHYVSLYVIGQDCEDSLRALFAELGMKCKPVVPNTVCYNAASKDAANRAVVGPGSTTDKNFPEGMTDDAIIKKLVQIICRVGTSGECQPPVNRMNEPIKKLAKFTRMISGWAAVIDDIRQNPNQFVMRTIRDEPITRWSAEMVQSGVDKAFRKTLEWTGPTTA